MSDDENDRFGAGEESSKRDDSSGDERRKRESGDEAKIAVRNGVKHIFVGPTGRRSGNQITYYANEKDLEDQFNEFGKVTEVKVRSNTKDVFAFVHFESSEGAARAIEGVNGKQINGVKVKCDWGSFNNSRSNRRPPVSSFRRRSQERDYGRDSGRSAYRRSPSPRYRRRSPSPRYSRHNSGYRPSPSPRHRRSPSPRYARRSPSPRYVRRSPSPRYVRRSPSPRYRRSPGSPPSYRR